MFHKAQRRKAYLRLALCGPSGSGKTLGALRLAQGLGGSIAMIDTEHGSGELYADVCDYDVAPLDAPYSPERYIERIEGAEKAGYELLIIDSLSHAWSGEGGILDIKDKVEKASRSANGFAAWREVTPEHNRLVEKILAAKLHVIVTMRTKTAYEIQQDEKGRSKPVKIGLAPVQRDGMEYEFTAVMDLSIDGHIATATKDRTRLLDGRPMQLDTSVGENLREWLESGVDPEQAKRDAADAVMQKIAKAASLDALSTLYSEAQTRVSPQYDPDLWAAVKEEFRQRGEELKVKNNDGESEAGQQQRQAS